MVWQIGIMVLKQKKVLLSKFFSIGSKPTADTFPELPHVLLWFRALLGTLFGLYMGLSGRQGAVGFVFGVNIVAFIPMAYCQIMLVADIDSYKHSLQFSGVLNALALALLIWIYCNTWTHAETEATMRAVAVMVKAAAVGKDSEVNLMVDDGTAMEVPTVDQEF